MIDAAANDALDALEACPCCLLGPQQRCLKTPYTHLDNTEIYSDMLRECFNIQLDVASDRCGICEECVVRLRDASHFKRQVQHIQRQLRERMARALKILEEVPPVTVKLETADEDGTNENLSGEELADEMAGSGGAGGGAAILEEHPVAMADDTGASEDSADCEEPDVNSEVADDDGTSDASSASLNQSEVKTRAQATALDRTCSVSLDQMFVDTEHHTCRVGSQTYKLSLYSRSPLPAQGGEGNKSRKSKSRSIASEAIIKKHVSKGRPPEAAVMEENNDWPLTVGKDGFETSQKRIKRETFEDKQEIKKHLKNIRNILLYTNATPIRRHTGFGYACAFCTTQYEHPGDLKEHTLRHHDASQIEQFMEGKHLNIFAPKLDITSLHCELCDTEINELEQLLVHLKDEHDKEVYTDVNNHIMPFKFDSEVLKCAVCEKEFVYFKKLQEHISFHYRNYLCSICSSPFMCKKSMQIHKNAHKQGEFPCDLCEKVFDTRAKKRDHKRFVHAGNRKMSKCPYCWKTFPNYGRRVQHIAEQHGGKPLQLKCNACPLIFKSRDGLTRHTKRDHLMERRHKCPLCDMRFFVKSELTCHMVKHNGERQYACDICQKAYARKKTLREHIKIHTDDRRFTCATCGYAFIQKCTLKSHMWSKHGELV